MAPEKGHGVIGKLTEALHASDRKAKLKARFASRNPQETERALADIGLSCGKYSPAETGDPVFHHPIPEMLERLEIDGDEAWKDASLMQGLRKRCFRCPEESRQRCRVWLNWEDAEDDYHAFCQNADDLDKLPRKT